MAAGWASGFWAEGACRRKAFPRAAATRSITSLVVAVASYPPGIAGGLKETEG